jgi:hypothetical protein
LIILSLSFFASAFTRRGEGLLGGSIGWVSVVVVRVVEVVVWLYVFVVGTRIGEGTRSGERSGEGTGDSS